jgi:hypothetical protein
MTEPIHYNTIQLPPGVWDGAPFDIEGPTRIFGAPREPGTPWQSTIRGSRALCHAVNAKYPLKIEGVEICHADDTGVHSEAAVILLDCWLHHCGGNGVMGTGPTKMDRCLVETVGSNPLQHHAAYCTEHVDITRSIIRGAALHLYPGSGRVSRCVLANPGGTTALYQCGDTEFDRCLIVGGVWYGTAGKLLDSATNILIPPSSAGWDYCVNMVRGFYWPPRDLGGRGPYAFKAERTFEWSGKRWPNGMFSDDPLVRNFYPLWPGE